MKLLQKPRAIVGDAASVTREGLCQARAAGEEEILCNDMLIAFLKNSLQINSQCL